MSGAMSVAEVLETNKVLEHLSLNNCDIGDDGVEPIAQGAYFISYPPSSIYFNTSNNKKD